MRKTDQTQTREIIAELSTSISNFFNSLLTQNSVGKWTYSLDDRSVSKLVNKMQREAANFEEGRPLLPGQPNTEAMLTFQQLQNFLKQAPTRMKYALKHGEFPAHVVDRSYKDAK